jgi:hypothetical protein
MENGERAGAVFGVVGRLVGALGSLNAVGRAVLVSEAAAGARLDPCVTLTRTTPTDLQNRVLGCLIYQ